MESAFQGSWHFIIIIYYLINLINLLSFQHVDWRDFYQYITSILFYKLIYDPNVKITVTDSHHPLTSPLWKPY